MPGRIVHPDTAPTDPISLWDDERLLELFTKHAVKPVHAQTVRQHLLAQLPHMGTDAARPDLEMSLLDGKVPRSLAELLRAHNVQTTTSTLERVEQSAGQGTVKLLVRLAGGQLIETVVMRYDQRDKASGRPRSTVCVSSQVGCKMRCTFCATGTMGLKGHLAAHEIIEQLVHALRVRVEPIRNVVFMGMGEPLDNYDAVLAAVVAMTDRRLFALAPSHVCVSTVGVVPRMQQLLRDAPGVRLALSLHAPTQELRTQIVPTSRAWPLGRLMDVVDQVNTCGDRVMIEYILIRDVNDTLECAHQLGELLHRKDVMVNLIPYNQTDVPHPYRAPLPQQAALFEGILRAEYGIRCTTRRTMGHDIDGACGQLVISAERQTVGDVEDLGDVGVKSVPKRPKMRRPADVSLPKGTTLDVGARSRSLVAPAALLFAVVSAIYALWIGYRLSGHASA